ncbi:MAG TPA: protein kinase, partial [Kofleriaceae bacterium]|nr:protein kinase [Kofleriaceae bacterium]
VLDFGSAKARGASTKTADGAVKGKYAYMAPEQLRGGAIDRRVDLFSLGVVMYEMVALRRLFQRKTDYLTFRAVMEQPIPDIRRYRPEIPDALANVLVRALDRDPTTRFESARQLGGAMLDALNAAGLRPWTQGDIGDFVKANFAEEIGKRSQQVMSAVSRTQPGAISTRSTMPLIIHEDATNDSSEDDEFPSVETDVDSTPRFVATNVEQPVSDPFGQSTPPPFSAETTGSALGLRPIQGTPASSMTNAPVVVVHKRSIMWPILAVAMIVVAGGALFLVWKQMQNQQQQPGPAPIIVTREPAPVETPPPPAGSAEVATPGSAAEPHPVKKPPKKFKSQEQGIEAALKTQQGPLNQCLLEHGQGVKDQMLAQFSIAASGKATSVQITPPMLNAAPVGACIRNVIMATPFPASDKDTSFTVSLKPKTS